MSSKKAISRAFRKSVFERDHYRCAICDVAGQDRQEGDQDLPDLDAHHVENRNKFPNGGYVTSNGISLCEDCHIKAEAYHATGTAVEGFTPKDLYTVIGSSFEQAMEDDLQNG